MQTLSSDKECLVDTWSIDTSTHISLSLYIYRYIHRSLRGYTCLERGRERWFLYLRALISLSSALTRSLFTEVFETPGVQTIFPPESRHSCFATRHSEKLPSLATGYNIYICVYMYILKGRQIQVYIKYIRELPSTKSRRGRDSRKILSDRCLSHYLSISQPAGKSIHVCVYGQIDKERRLADDSNDVPP